MSIIMLVCNCLLLPALAGGSTAQQDLLCTDSYAEFESATVGSNASASNIRNQLYRAFYPPNQHLPYSVLVTYQLVFANGTRFNLSWLCHWTVGVAVFFGVPSRRHYISQSPTSLHSQLLHGMEPTPCHYHHNINSLSWQDWRLPQWNDCFSEFVWHSNSWWLPVNPYAWTQVLT